MRRLIAIYLIGIAVQVWPAVAPQWNSASAARLTAIAANRLPDAAAWPVRVWDRLSKIAALAGLTGDEPQAAAPTAPAPSPQP
jgi:hypothetical protein